MNLFLDRIGRSLATFLSRPRHIHGAALPTAPERLLACLQPADVLLIEGNSRISTAIKYLTQSTWSHAAMYVGSYGQGRLSNPSHCFVEADVVEGVRSVGVDDFSDLHSRICRPVGLNEDDRRAVAEFAIARLGHRYDLKNVIDLARYLLPTPPVPTRWRRRMIALGSGDPTRAICSTLIARAFQSIRYPILPAIVYRSAATAACPGCVDEVWRIRHHTLFTPRDFDVSPYFRVVKPIIEGEFDFRALTWDVLPPVQNPP